MWRFLAFTAVIVAVAAFGFSLVDGGDGEVAATAQLGSGGTGDISGFARALAPREWQFPLDHGAHPDFQTEWWYYTGNLADADGRRFGYQFTVFRRALTAQPVSGESEWRSGQIYMAHFTISDLAGEGFYHEERYARGGAGLAGALPIYNDPTTHDAAYQVWLEDWRVEATNADQTAFRLSAATDDFAVDLDLTQVKPVALQGDNGYSVKGQAPGNASNYYSLSRLETTGSLSINDETFTVSGASWMDHEFGTGVLAEETLGWHWFGLILDDGREIMIGEIRVNDPDDELPSLGLLVNADGSTVNLDLADVALTPTETWTSPHTGATYPIAWTITVAGAALDQDADLRLEITPMMADQELNSGDIAYWEGAVHVSGTDGAAAFSGYGYAELTGYVDAMTGRF